MILVQFAIATAVTVALQLAINALTQEEGSPQDETRAVLKSSYGFPLEKPFGKKWRLRSRNIFWGLPIKDEDEEVGGKGSSSGNTQRTSYATFAVLGGWGEIKRITKIWVGSELFWEWDGDSESSFKKAKKRKYIKDLEIFLGTEDQLPSSIIQEYEGIGNVNSLKHRFYIVLKQLEVNPGSGYPTVDIETESVEQTLPEVLDWVCKAKNLTDAQIDIDPALEAYTEVNIDLLQDGGTVGDFIKELQKSYFFFTIDTGEKIIFRDFFTPETLSIVNLTLDNLAATEDNDNAIDRYLLQVPDPLDLPSELQFEYISSDRDYDRGFQPAFRHDAKHYSDLVVKTRQNLNDEQSRNIAWKTLGIYWSQSRRIESLSVLPSIGKELEMGNLFKIPIDDVDHLFQLEKKEIGDNDLVEISGVSYDKIEPDFKFSTPTFINQALPEIAIGRAIALDIPLIRDADSELGLYVGVVSSDNWQNGAVYVSDNEGNSYAKLTNFTGQSTTGLVTQIPQANSSDIIDYGSEIVVRLDNGILESLPEIDFLALKQFGLFGNEFIAWQNAELISTNTYKLTKLLRGLRGTEGYINQHSLNERFILLQGTGARLVRVPGSITDLGKTLIFKAVHSGQTLDEITDEVSLTVTGEGLKPYSPVYPEVLYNTSTYDLTIEWSLRTRINGQWRNGVDITYSDSDRSILQILAGANIVHTVEVTGYQASYTLTAAEQLEKLGGLQDHLDFNIYQISDLIGLGNPLIVIDIKPTKFV